MTERGAFSIMRFVLAGAGQPEKRILAYRADEKFIGVIWQARKH